MEPMKAGRLLLTVLMALAMAACGTPPDDPTPSVSVAPTPARTASPDVTPTPTPTPSATRESPAGDASEPPIADDPAPIGLETVAGGLDAPISVAAMPDGRLLVNERAGRVVTVDPDDGSVRTALDISDRVLGQAEQGLLGLALHPAWPDEPAAFVHYTDRQGRTVLSRFTASSTDGPQLDPGSEEVLLRVDQPFSNHNGGQVAFGPDGLLHLGLGDGGAGGDPLGNAQDPGTLLGTILRIDVDAPGAAPEVLFHGLRNPWRFSFDRQTGDLWIADVGQSALEEINRVDPVADAGGNLGWNVMEGSRCYADAACADDGFIGPVTEYGRDLGCSVTGGYVYRGDAIDGLAGWYLFGDYCAGTIFGVRSDVAELTAPRILLDTDAAISAFGEDAGGELYLADLAGTLYRIVRG